MDVSLIFVIYCCLFHRLKLYFTFNDSFFAFMFNHICYLLRVISLVSSFSCHVKLNKPGFFWLFFSRWLLYYYHYSSILPFFSLTLLNYVGRIKLQGSRTSAETDLRFLFIWCAASWYLKKSDDESKRVVFPYTSTL